MVYFRLKFTLSGQPRTALLTDRGWTLISGTAGQDALLNHMFPLRPMPNCSDAVRADRAAVCAARAAEILRGTIDS